MSNLGSLRGGSRNAKLTRLPGSGARRYLHSGVDTVVRLEYRRWKIRINMRQQGIAIKRNVFTVEMDGVSAPFRHTLGRYSTKQSAIDAAYEYIDTWFRENGERHEEQMRRQEREAELRRVRRQLDNQR